MRLIFAGFSFLLAVAGCRSQPEERRPWRAQIGVFFGGQVQQLEQIEYSKLDPPHVGFRLDVPRFPAAGVERVHFELVVPGPAGRRITKTSHLEISSGPREVDQLFDVPDQARHGVWNVRIVRGEIILADRALHVVKP